MSFGHWVVRAGLGLSLGAAVLAISGCGAKESVVTVGGDKKLSADDIDKDPMALLPGNAVAWAQVDAQAFLASSVGPSALKLSQNLIPLTPEMNFQPSRDLKTVVAGIYSTSGADVAAIAQGTFDVDAIKKAADRGAMTAMGQPLRKSDYAGNELYVTGDVGFVLLTAKTLLCGNPAGMRRALDRIRDGRVKREVPDWVLDVMKTPNAQLVVVGDTTGQAVPAAVLQQAPFLAGVRTARILGNFQPPGMNFAGSFTYGDPQGAAAGQGQLNQLQQMAGLLNLLAPFGVSSPLKQLQTNIAGNDLQFLAAIDGAALGALVGQLGALTAFSPAMMTPQPKPASPVR